MIKAIKLVPAASFSNQGTWAHAVLRARGRREFVQVNLSQSPASVVERVFQEKLATVACDSEMSRLFLKDFLPVFDGLEILEKRELFCHEAVPEIFRESQRFQKPRKFWQQIFEAATAINDPVGRGVFIKTASSLVPPKSMFRRDPGSAEEEIFKRFSRSLEVAVAGINQLPAVVSSAGADLFSANTYGLITLGAAYPSAYGFDAEFLDQYFGLMCLLGSVNHFRLGEDQHEVIRIKPNHQRGHCLSFFLTTQTRGETFQWILKMVAVSGDRLVTDCAREFGWDTFRVEPQPAAYDKSGKKIFSKRYGLLEFIPGFNCEILRGNDYLAPDFLSRPDFAFRFGRWRAFDYLLACADGFLEEHIYQPGKPSLFRIDFESVLLPKTVKPKDLAGENYVLYRFFFSQPKLAAVFRDGFFEGMDVVFHHKHYLKGLIAKTVSKGLVTGIAQRNSQERTSVDESDLEEIFQRLCEKPKRVFKKAFGRFQID